MDDRQRLRTTIAALEAQRQAIGDAVVDAAVAPLRARLMDLGDGEAILRQATILFMDVVGSTALSHRLEPEDIDALMSGAMKRLTSCVEHRGGRVMQ